MMPNLFAQTALWDNSKGPLLTLRGKTPISTYSGFTPGTLFFNLLYLYKAEVLPQGLVKMSKKRIELKE